jgi:hypothetical protein
MTDFSSRLQTWLDLAQEDYLLRRGNKYTVAIRKRPGASEDYVELEHFLRDHPLVKVTDFRRVKEGRVYVSRPCELTISWEALINYRPLVKSLRQEVDDWRKDLFEMGVCESFLSDNLSLCLRSPGVTRACFQVFSYLLDQRLSANTDLLPRQLPHSESSKLIGRESLLLKLFSKWRGESASWSDFYRRFRILRTALEFRIFAPVCILQGHEVANFHGLVSSNWSDQFDFSLLEQTLIVENFQTLQALAPFANKTLLVFGSGWAASQLLELESMLPKPAYYWGDMDKEGYEILAHLLEKNIELQPILMDDAIYQKFHHLGVTKPSYFGPFKSLPIGLRQPYEAVCKNGLLIEQEKIPISELPIEI